jgi:hypothetical protein
VGLLCGQKKNNGLSEACTRDKCGTAKAAQAPESDAGQPENDDNDADSLARTWSEAEVGKQQ